MKPVHLLAGLGVVLILGFGGWYMYMQRSPPYEQSTERALDVKKAKPAAEIKKAEAAKATEGDKAPK
jgi:hypothetical protein